MAEHQDFFNTHKPKSTAGIFEHVLGLLPTQPTGLAYDLCCGTGKLSARLQARGYTTYGVDIAEQFIGSEGTEAQGYALADVEHLPFADESADLVTCIDSLQYFADPARTLAEMARLLRPNGQLILSTQNNYNLAGLKKWMLKHVFGQEWSPWLLHPVENHLTYPHLLKLCQQAGLTVDYVRGKQFLTAWVSVLPAGIRHWSVTGKGHHTLASWAGRTSFPPALEESPLAQFAMIVLLRARKK